jgi:hypothetical protein
LALDHRSHRSALAGMEAWKNHGRASDASWAAQPRLRRDGGGPGVQCLNFNAGKPTPAAADAVRTM